MEQLNFNKKHSIDLVTVGEVLIDFISDAYDTVNTSFTPHFGGSPANIAMNTKCLGLDSRLIACVGNDPFGTMIKQELTKRNMDLSSIQEVTDSTSMVVVTRSQGTPIPLFYRGADYQIDLKKHLDLLLNTKVIHFSAWVISKKALRDQLEAIIYLAKEHGILISFDPNYHPALFTDEPSGIGYIKKFIGLSDIIKPSLDDAIRIFGEGYKTEEYIQMFSDLGAKLVIMTLGKDGLIATTSTSEYHVPSYAKHVVDTTGAGDAFWSGFYYSSLNGESIHDALTFGSIVSAYKLEHLGAIVDYPDVNTLKEMYK